MQLSKLKLEDNDMLLVSYTDVDTDAIDEEGNRITPIEFQEAMIRQFKEMYPDLLVSIAINTNIDKLSEEQMNELGWYRKDD